MQPKAQPETMRQQAGIAIAPILFVIAILAVLVGAIAAGGGFDGSGAAQEGRRVNASTIIEQGANLKAGFERLNGGALDVNEIVFSTTYSSAMKTKALFASEGGSLGPQRSPANTVPVSGVNTWRFVQSANLPGIGQSGANDLVAVIGVLSPEICKMMNLILFGKVSTLATTLPSVSTATIVLNSADACTDTFVDTTTSTCNLAANRFDVSATTALNGLSQACVDAGSGIYYYYQLLLAK